MAEEMEPIPGKEANGSQAPIGGALIFVDGRPVLVVTGAIGGDPDQRGRIVEDVLAAYELQSGRRIEREQVQLSTAYRGGAARDADTREMRMSSALAEAGGALAFCYGGGASEPELIAAQAREIQRLRSDALLDPLTGVANRRHAGIRLRKCMHSALRHKQALSIAFIDLDNFKACNQSGGLEHGDDVLRQWSQLLQASLRREDFLARYGGDEFLLLLPMTTRRAAATVLERLRTTLAEHPLHEKFGLTFSAGAASLAELSGAEDSDALLMIAGRRLLEAKRSGPANIIID